MDMTAQLERERTMSEQGARRVKSQIDKALARGDAADTPGAIQQMRRALEPLSAAITAFVQARGTAGRRATAAVFLEKVDPDLAAYLTLKIGLSAASQVKSLKGTALTLANALAAELLADSFDEANSALFRAIIRNAQSRGLAPARQAKAVQLAAKHFDVVPPDWTSAQRINLGLKLLELAIEHTPLLTTFDRVTGTGAKTVTSKRLVLGDGVGDWINRYNRAAGVARPMYLPSVAPPKPWDDVTGGSYYSPIAEGRQIVSRTFPGQLDALRGADLGVVYKALNGLQETPWRINGRVYEVMKRAWDKGLPLPCLPSREDEPLPPKPEGIELSEPGSDIRKEYRRAARVVHERNTAARSKRFEFARGLAIAADNIAEAAIYFPHRCDFRGRCYASATTLNPQGPDEIKALLEFAEAKPLGERGAFWLGVHGANLFGNDKVSLEERYQWAKAHQEKASAVAFDPLANLWWTEADKPWSFLAWCMEWGEVPFHAVETYRSRIAVALDGSCNGIQHYSAMLRDPVGGAAVNLVPSDKPQDIYQRVADRVKEKIAAIVPETEHAEHAMAWGWAHFPIDRKVTKRAVMVLPYGGMFKSCMDYVWDAVQEKIAGGAENPFGEDLRAASNWLAKQVWDSIGDVVVSSREAMTWLQKVSRIASKHNVAITWTAPSGFAAVQAYKEFSNKRVETKFMGSIVKFRSVDPTDKIDAARQASAIAPNFVHSMDAAAMKLTIARCLERGIGNFAMIHDSYGTHAADTEVLASTLRECFVAMYRDRDVLAEFEDSVKAALPEGTTLPPRPEFGTLDLEGVLKSAYFFA